MQTFSKSERLSKKIIIDKLFSEGKYHHTYPFILVSLKLKADSSTVVLIHVPKKKIKKAVTRNLIKRKIREVYRLNKSFFLEKLENQNINIALAIIYNSREVEDFQNIERCLIEGLRKLNKYYETYPD